LNPLVTSACAEALAAALHIHPAARASWGYVFFIIIGPRSAPRRTGNNKG
jgi:hypothetical protein